MKSTNKMFDSAEEPLDLIYISAADNAGKGNEEQIQTNMDFLMGRLKIYKEIMCRPYVTGADLVEAGLVEVDRDIQLWYNHGIV